MNKRFAVVAILAGLLTAGSYANAGHVDAVGGLKGAENAQDGKSQKAQAGGACVDTKGTWVNWPWPNVPTLSPPCSSPAPEPAEKK
jgi:hypothetical protein